MGGLHRWSMMLQPFDFSLEYIKGQNHIVADSLSRRDYDPCTDDTMDKLFLEQTVHVIDRLPETLLQNGSVTNKFTSSVNLTLNFDSKERITKQQINMLNRPINTLDNSRNLVNLHPDFIQQIGKQMSYILRHGANFEKVLIDPQGFIAILDLVNWFRSKLNIQITIDTIIDLVKSDRKSRFSIEHERVCTLYGHSLYLLNLNLLEYDELAYRNKRYIIHDTYAKYLPAILSKGLSRMGRNNVHLTLFSGRAGIQQNRKPNIAIYINMQKAKRHAYTFLQCDNDVILCPGDKDGFISPYFFHEIREINTGAVIFFNKPIGPMFNANNELTLGEEKETFLVFNKIPNLQLQVSLQINQQQKESTSTSQLSILNNFL